MKRVNLDIEEATADLNYFVSKARGLDSKYERLAEIGNRLNSFGVSSPKIMSKEEAKYQKGTRIYSDRPLLELMDAEERLSKEIRLDTEVIHSIANNLHDLDLSEFQMNLLHYYFEKRWTYNQIGERFHIAWQTVQRNIVLILEKYSDCYLKNVI